MTSASELALDTGGKGCSTTSTGVRWDDIPTEIFTYIFKKLDIQSIRCCLAVSRKWKEIAKSLCEHENLWQALAEDGIVNYGVTHHFKSRLGWRDLYLNSLLWNNLQSATINKINETETLCVKTMHVYRDKLIVVIPNGVQYYDIESFQSISFCPIEFCEDFQEADEIFMLVTGNGPDNTCYYKVNVIVKEDKDEPMDVGKYCNPTFMCQNSNALFTFDWSWCWRLVGNYGYIIDARSVLWKCYQQQESLSVTALSRFYGDFQFSAGCSLNFLHVSKQDVYIALKWGNMLVVSEGSMLFRKVNKSEIPTTIIEASDTNKRTPHKEDAAKLEVFITVPFGIGLPEGLSSKNLLHFHYDDPAMTSGLQHGDVVFRGFEDGRIEITLLRDNSRLELNIQQFDEHVKDPAVIGLEVCELKHMHKLFVATADKLYMLLLTYPKKLLETFTEW